MKTIRVRYTVREDYVEQNKANIRAVMEALNAKGEDKVRYTVFVEADGRTFVHLAVLPDPESNPIPALPEFAAFRAGLKGGAETPPETEEWSLVGSNF